MNKIIFGNQGQYGDLCINTVVAKRLKQQYPNDFLVMSVNKRYIDIIPAFFNHDYIDSFVIWDGYDNWPSEIDKKVKIDTSLMYSPMPHHTNNLWYKRFHQTEEAAFMNGYKGDRFENGEQCILNKWFDTKIDKKIVSFAPFAGFYNSDNDKKLSIANAQTIVDLVSKMGYTVLQLGGLDEPSLENTIRPKCSYFESLKLALNTKYYIGTDTGMTWFLSAYSHPTLGLYSHQYYSEQYIKNIQPINPNAIYLNSSNLNSIPLDYIESKLSLF